MYVLFIFATINIGRCFFMAYESNRVLITGNGFDLALGYRTRYEDFMKFLLNSKDKTFDDFFLFVKKEWRIQKSNKKVIKSFYDAAGKVLSNNFIIEYLNNFHSKTLSWADFETEILHIGNCLESIVSALQDDKSLVQDGYIIALPFNGDIKYYVNYLSFFKNNSLFFIDVDNPSRDEVYFYIKDKEILKSKGIRTQALRFINEIPNRFYKALLELSDLFDLYLQIESSRRITNKKIKYNFNGVITYNYTNFYNSNTYVFHVNGETSNNDSEGVIFGVDSNWNFRTTKFDGVTKKVQRLAHNIRLGEVDSFLKMTTELYVFGFSLPVADKDSIKYFLTKTNPDSLNNIYIFYKSSGNKNGDLINKMQLTSNLKEILDDAYDGLSNKIMFMDSEEFFAK